MAQRMSRLSYALWSSRRRLRVCHFYSRMQFDSVPSPSSRGAANGTRLHGADS